MSLQEVRVIGVKFISGGSENKGRTIKIVDEVNGGVMSLQLQLQDQTKGLKEISENAKKKKIEFLVES